MNPGIKNDTYPQPTPEELFSKIQGGERFSKIDLTKAYLQVELDDESQSKGIKQSTRMSYGLKPATGIFKRFMENALANIPCTAVKVDDILISGKTEYESLRKHRKSI